MNWELFFLTLMQPCGFITSVTLEKIISLRSELDQQIKAYKFTELGLTPRTHVQVEEEKQCLKVVL